MEGVTFECPSCGGRLILDPKTKKLTCESCKREYSALEISKQKDSFDEFEEDKEVFSEEDHTICYHCEACGGEIIVLDTVVSSSCPYCGSHVLLKNKLFMEHKPKYIIPFSRNEEEVMGLIDKYLKRIIYLPTFFKKRIKKTAIYSLYAPFYLVSGVVKYDYRLFESNRDNEIISLDGDKRQEEHTQITIQAECYFSHVPVHALAEVEHKAVKGIEPFDIKGIEQFKAPYLAGHLAKRYDVDKDIIEERSKEKIETGVQGVYKRKLNIKKLESVTVSNVKLSKMKLNYSFFPIWVVRVKWGWKQYQVLVNDQTGKVFGSMPLSFTKCSLFLTLFILAFGLPIFGLVYLFSRNLSVSISLGIMLGVFFGLIVFLGLYIDLYCPSSQVDFSGYIEEVGKNQRRKDFVDEEEEKDFSKMNKEEIVFLLRDLYKKLKQYEIVVKKGAMTEEDFLDKTLYTKKSIRSLIQFLKNQNSSRYQEAKLKLNELSDMEINEKIDGIERLMNQLARERDDQKIYEEYANEEISYLASLLELYKNEIEQRSIKQ